MDNSREYPQPPERIVKALRTGMVIPAHPLALKEDKTLDERHQKALSRYYLDAGAGGLAVGVHTTEFAIHDPKIGLYRPVLELAMETVRGWQPLIPASDPPLMVAGVIGATAQAVREAETARELGYHMGLLGLGALKEASDDQLVDHARKVAGVLPIMGFYLQPAVGGRILSERFWRRLAEIPNLVAIKMAPFNRYYTLTVIRAVAAAGRAGEVALYTGNDDSILVDLLTRFEIALDQGSAAMEIVGGLLGHWAYWTTRAVEQLEQVRGAKRNGAVPAQLLTLAAQVTESNGAIFDPENDFRGCISGILYVLASSGLISGVNPLGAGERLSSGQAKKIDAVMTRYPHLTDHQFVRENLDRWLA
ncbi:MAG: dihydrodipicolinate synthase family protein [Spirochaetaceae bacterium]|nr:MAG: dihydrodipicolinate synthase family protein [Spirochaetaceae bacterium]